MRGAVGQGQREAAGSQRGYAQLFHGAQDAPEFLLKPIT